MRNEFERLNYQCKSFEKKKEQEFIKKYSTYQKQEHKEKQDGSIFSNT